MYGPPCGPWADKAFACLAVATNEVRRNLKRFFDVLDL
jgi:hypothetical protein